jgi:hypothetical protein
VAVANLVFAYAERIDAGDFAGVAELFRHGGITAEGGGPPWEGADQVRRMYESWTRRYEDDGTPHTKHVTTNLILDIDEEEGTATARSYWTVLQAVPGLPLQPILAGRYHDRFERADRVWRFSERRYLVDLVGDVSQHMLDNLPS